MAPSASLPTPVSTTSVAGSPAPFLADALLLSRVLFLLALLAQILVEFRFWHLTWDDSAITLGFAQTFAHTGRIEATPGSGIVEGYSTTLWMLLMALAAKLVTSPAALLAAAKLSTLALNLLNLVLIRRWFRLWTTEVLANLVAATFGCWFMLYETINGMETPLILALVFTMLLLRRSTHRLAPVAYLVAGSLLLLTRWEAAWFLVPFLLTERPLRRALQPALVWAGVFLASNLLRLWYFGAILPNTILAKHGIPYTEPTAAGELRRHLLDPKFILFSCSGIVAILIAVLLLDHFKDHFKDQSNDRSSDRPTAPASTPSPRTGRLRHAYNLASPELRFCLLFIAALLLLDLAVGSNTGPDVRAFFPAWPFVFGLLFLPILNDDQGRIGPRAASLSYPFAVVALCLLSLNHLRTRIRDLRSATAPVYEPNATVRKIAAVGTAIADVQQASGRHDLLFAGPDMGGIMLYADGVRLVDLGLLCDRTLARYRYGMTHDYVLVQKHPDIIEVHQRWLDMTRLDRDPLFLDRYRPVYANNTRLFLERNLLAAIPASRLTEEHFTPTGHLASPTADQADRTIYSMKDRALNRAFGTYFVLN